MSDTVEQQTLGDLRSVSRYFRSRYGPLYDEIDLGALTMAVTGEPITLRRLLQILDADDVAVRQIDIYGNEHDVKAVHAMFSAYRRLRRAEKRLADHCREKDGGQ